MTIKDARKCGIPLNEIIEGDETYNDMKSSAQSGDLKSILDFAMWNEIQGDLCFEKSIQYYDMALSWYKKAIAIDETCSGKEAYDELMERIGR